MNVHQLFKVIFPLFLVYIHSDIQKRLYSLRGRVSTPEAVTLVDQDRIIVSVEVSHDRGSFQSDNCNQPNVEVVAFRQINFLVVLHNVGLIPLIVV